MYTTLISAEQLAALPSAQTVILDCRFQLTDSGWGQQAYDAGHLPDAHYLNLDYHLSGTKTGQNGRHPLPDGQRLAVVLGALGVTPATQVVVYDDLGGQYAARAWWLLKWLGHDAVAVLDGGLPAWQANGGVLTTEAPASHPTRFAPKSARVGSVDVDAVLANLDQDDFLVVDARAPGRYRGEGETIDPVGGHIPGAANRFFQDNLGADGRFKPVDQLRAEWQAVIGEREPAEVVHQCGSGVTACVNLLAMEHAGLAGSRLYPGSWSEWCSDPARPVAR
ncbi:sulfurtransferase [Neisseriaceae bacterium JH1-16]|nr:sulfurtransferase [Neisseriaceae bacterium JH1-16]